MLQDAAKHFELLAQGYTKLFGTEHPKTVDTSHRLKRREGAGNDTGVVDGEHGDGERGSHYDDVSDVDAMSHTNNSLSTSDVFIF